MKKKNKKIKRKVGKKIKPSVQWAELPKDLLDEINSRLCSSDQVRFHAVCKNWFPTIDRYNKPLPWVINIYDSGLCKLYEPSSSSNLKPTFVYKPGLDQSRVSIKNTIVRMTIHKHGWLICFDEKDEKYHSMLLFSPFTKKVIRLPRLTYCPDLRMLETFSTEPNARDCVFLVLYDNAKEKRITIKTFCYQYKRWSCRRFDRPDNFDRCCHIPVYISGIFYFVFPLGKLASYNVARKEWKVDSFVVENVSLENIIDYSIYGAFELEGELVLIGICKDSGFIRKLIRCSKAWVTLKSLGDRSLFCSYQSILVSTIGNEAKTRGALPNKIYLRDGARTKRYSLENGKLAEFAEGSGIKSWANVDCVCGDFFEPADVIVKRKQPRYIIKPSLLLCRKNNNPKKRLLSVVPEQQQSDTEGGIVEELENQVMDQTEEQSTEEDDDELENFRVLDQMWRSRNYARENNTWSIRK